MFSSIALWQNHIHLENNYQTFSTNFFARIFANCGISIPNVKSWFNLRFVGVKPKWPLPEPITSLKLFCRAQNHIVEHFLVVCVLFHSKPANACELRDFWWETRISGFRNIKYRIWHCCRTYKYSHYIISKIRCERFSERMVMAFLKRAHNFPWLVELRLQPRQILFWKCGEDTLSLAGILLFTIYEFSWEKFPLAQWDLPWHTVQKFILQKSTKQLTKLMALAMFYSTKPTKMCIH